jgi:hypothetical protein
MAGSRISANPDTGCREECGRIGVNPLKAAQAPHTAVAAALYSNFDSKTPRHHAQQEADILSVFLSPNPERAPQAI